MSETTNPTPQTIQIDKKTFAIGVLSLTAVILFVANVMQPPQAQAQTSIKGSEYQAVTARVSKGGEALYLTQNFSGKMAVFGYDPNKRAVVPIAIEPLSKAFAGGAAPDRPNNNKRTGSRQ
jgi:hypothetical protein